MPATEKQAMHDKDNYALPLKRIDHIELYVGNALHTAHYFCTAFGFTKTAYAGLETGVRDRLSIVLEQNNVRLVLTSPLTPEGDIAQHIGKHGDGIKDIAFLTDDAVEVFDEAVKRGAVAMGKPAVFRDRNGEAVKATISGCGDTVHSFITRDKYEGSFFPDYHPAINKRSYKSCGLEAIDHVAFGLEPGTLSRWVEFYEQVFGFYQSHQEDVFTEYSGMNTKVVQNGSGSVRFPMMEPVPGKRKSQIEEYLIYH